MPHWYADGKLSMRLCIVGEAIYMLLDEEQRSGDLLAKGPSEPWRGVQIADWRRHSSFALSSYSVA